MDRPQGFQDLSHSAFTVLVLERIRDIENSAAAERRCTGTHVLGRRAVLAQKWNARPASREPRRQLGPGVAARSKWSRIEAVLRNRAFRDAYAAAREALVAGIRDVVFPAGIYRLHRFTQAVCEPRPAPG